MMNTRLMKSTTSFAFLSLALFCATSAQAVTIGTVPVGNAGNTGELQSQGTFGAVSYGYRIGTTEVTNSQYVGFLNAVAASDPYTLYDTNMGTSWGGITRSGSSGSYAYAVKPDSIGNGPGGADGDDYTYGDKPVVYVSWYDSIRFTNWLHNGQGAGATETGAYTLLGGTPTPSNGLSITRNSGATWFLTSEDEWYKAAYHQNDGVTGNYYDYPTSTDTTPNNNLPSTDTGNSANFDDSGYTTGDVLYPMTDVGAYGLSDSPYGTFDQGGNVWEWNEALISSSARGIRGGGWINNSDNLLSSDRVNDDPTDGNINIGFRVASIPVPEPSTLLLGAMASLGLLVWRRR